MSNEQNTNETYYIFRGDRSGVFAGNLVKQDGQNIKMSNVRRLWYWDGAASLSQMANEGVKKPENCKFTVTVASIEILDCVEILTCTPEAEANIKAVSDWRID